MIARRLSHQLSNYWEASMSNKAPQIRFNGYSDAWEERKFGELLREFSLKSIIEDEYNVLSSTNSGMEFREGRVSGTSNLGYKIIKNGDLVLSPQNLWLGNININNIGKGLVSPSYKTFEFRNIDSSFINPQLRTQKMLEEYKNSSTQGASVVRRNLEIDSFYKIKIFVPTITEQEKIGSFFKQLDNTIALHQRKLDLLKEQKKGYLQKVFPKNGAKVPELRFEGFADDWVQRKLTDITKSYSGLTYKPEDIQESGTFVLRSSNVKNGQLVDADNVHVNSDVVNSKNVEPGDVVVVVRNGSRSLIGKHAIVTDDMPNTVIGAFMSAFRGENGTYVNALLSTENFDREVNKSLGATINQITGKDFSMMKFATPELSEQQEIGSFFAKLDEVIAANQRKLDLLKKQKKGYLQKMFV